MGTLSTNRQTLAMTHALIALDFDLALDVLGDVAPQVTFDGCVAIYPGTDLVDLVLGEIANPLVGVESGIGADALRRGLANTKDVRECYLQPLLAGDINAGNTCHYELFLICLSSALALLVTRIFADHHDATVPADHLALFANFLDTRPNLHDERALLLVSIRNTAPGEVVRGEFYLHLVAWKNSNVVHSHFSGDVRQHFVAVLKFDPKHCVGKRLENRAFKHDGVVFWLGQSSPPRTVLQNARARMRISVKHAQARQGRGTMLSAARWDAKPQVGEFAKRTK